ncbi:MAG: hypothetical protein ACOX9R_00780 [Armatimonadota bacterium]|jgi:hypothetical protein
MLRKLPIVLGLLALTVAVSAQELPEVPPVDLAGLSPDDFADDELDIPYYLHHFHTLANSIIEEGENRGFIDIPVWRREQDNEPYNARVMENHLSFAWFYCTDRPWNPYHGHPAVRARLEAVLDFWVRMQNEDGRFSEYGVERWNLPATAFATKFMGRTLELLADGPPIDEELHRRVIEADRRAITVTLTDEGLHSHGTRFANQFSNVWAGAFAYVDLFGDEEIRQLLEARLATSKEDFMSPAGYFYEANGPDWSYNMGTEQSNMRMAYHYTKDGPLGDAFIEKMELWLEWVAYNSVPEPESSRWVLNRCIETRTARSSFFTIGNLAVADRVPLARVWVTTQEQHESDIAARREALVESWPEMRELRLGDFSSFSPYTFLHRDHHLARPTEAEREEALALIPHIGSDRFIHQRVDSRFPVQYTFVRRPGYYAALTTGEQVRPRQRYGLGLVWTPALGAVLQSQTDAGATAWGTRTAEAERPHEAGSLAAEFTVGDAAIEPEPGVRDLPDGTLRVRWPLGDDGQKTLIFTDEAIEVLVEQPGAFSEQLPLLLEEEPEVLEGAIAVSGQTLVAFDQAGVEIESTSTRIGDKRLWTVALRASDVLGYRIIGGR